MKFKKALNKVTKFFLLGDLKEHNSYTIHVRYNSSTVHACTAYQFHCESCSWHGELLPVPVAVLQNTPAACCTVTIQAWSSGLLNVCLLYLHTVTVIMPFQLNLPHISTPGHNHCVSPTFIFIQNFFFFECRRIQIPKSINKISNGSA